MGRGLECMYSTIASEMESSGMFMFMSADEM